MEHLDLVITKATVNKGGQVRWALTGSDTRPDKTLERTTVNLFHDWIDRVEKNKQTSFLPPVRMPFLGLSHYPSLDGRGEGGIPHKMYVDGKCFKAQGIFNESPLGGALSQAILTERAMIEKGAAPDNPIRISAGWYDLSHEHTDHNYTFVRQSLSDKCPICARYGNEARADKNYISGQLDHFACTRVPMYEGTAITAYEPHEVMKSMTTRLEDAKTIVPDELAEALNAASVAVGKSESESGDELPEGMVVRSEDEDTDPDTEKAGGKKKFVPFKKGQNAPGAAQADDDEDESEDDSKATKAGSKKKRPAKFSQIDEIENADDDDDDIMESDMDMDDDDDKPKRKKSAQAKRRILTQTQTLKKWGILWAARRGPLGVHCPLRTQLITFKGNKKSIPLIVGLAFSRP